MGNTKVLDRYECDYLRDAAIAVTKITTGREPAPLKPIYGERALDVAFDFGGIAGGQRWSMDAGKYRLITKICDWAKMLKWA